MSKQETRPNDAAFSKNGDVSYNDYVKKHFYENTGLTKREYFAAISLQGLLSNLTKISGEWTGQLTPEFMANQSVEISDALINALNDEKPNE